MEKPFVYGMSVAGANFTDRVRETARLKQDFENGVNVILISPRRMGKTSLVRRVRGLITDPSLRVVMMDIYDCRSEYDFYNRFAAAVLKETAGPGAQFLAAVRRFLGRLTPRVSFSPEPMQEFSVQLGLTPQNYSPEEVLDLPERVAREAGLHIVVCIDEFQQIGEMPDTLTVQKRLRGVWQHQQHVSYCLYGSKKHLMSRLFQHSGMPFFRFGEMNELPPIAASDWVPFIVERFRSKGKTISPEQALRICGRVDCHSSYVQQLAWNVMAESDDVVDEAAMEAGWRALLAQTESYFKEQIKGLSTYQMNFLRLLCCGVRENFCGVQARQRYDIGSKSNVSRLRAALTDRELIEDDTDGRPQLADVVFAHWFRQGYM